MAALTSLALGAGLISMGTGAFNMFEGSQAQKAGYNEMSQGAQLQAQAAAQQAAISKAQAASSVVFAGRERDIENTASQQSITAAASSRDLQQSTIAEQQKINQQNYQAMEVNARRQQLQNVRTQQQARSLALATNVAQGGSGAVNGSSALHGAYGQISGQFGVNQTGVTEALATGENIFASNSKISQNNIAGADLNYNYALQQATNQTAKSNLTYDYATSNANYQTQLADTQTLMSQGAGMISMGQGQVGMGNSQYQMGSSLFSAGPNIFSMGQSANQLFGSNLFGGTNSTFINPFNQTGSLY